VPHAQPISFFSILSPAQYWVHQYTWHQDTQQLRSIIDYVIARQNSGLKFEDARVFRRMTVGIDHYLVNAKILFAHGKSNQYK
jgi:hypothetical protein